MVKVIKDCLFAVCVAIGIVFGIIAMQGYVTAPQKFEENVMRLLFGIFFLVVATLFELAGHADAVKEANGEGG